LMVLAIEVRRLRSLLVVNVTKQENESGNTKDEG
jgi:hypothetical protein